jgi:inorganic triphosphatase YgiF
METELKLSLSAPDLPRLLAHPLLTQAGNTQRLLNTYFDTPDLAL